VNYTLADLSQIRRWSAVKRAGYLALLTSRASTLRIDPLGISIKAYARHLEPFNARSMRLQHSGDFQANPKLRFLMLEGPDDFALKYPDDLPLRDGSSRVRPAIRWAICSRMAAFES